MYCTDTEIVEMRCAGVTAVSRLPAACPVSPPPPGTARTAGSTPPPPRPRRCCPGARRVNRYILYVWEKAPTRGLTSMLYLSLASFLSSRAGTQGKKQPRTQQRRPDLLRASAFLSSVLVTTAAGRGCDLTCRPGRARSRGRTCTPRSRRSSCTVPASSSRTS